MGASSCGPSRFACMRSSIFPSLSTFPRSCTIFFSRCPALSRNCFRVPTLLQFTLKVKSGAQLPVKLRYNGGGGGDLVSSECCRAPNRSYASQNDVILHGYLWVTKEYIYQRILFESEFIILTFDANKFTF